MTKQLTLGALLGGIIAFAWSAASWMVMPWHASTLLAFHDADDIAHVIADHAPRSGMYVYPLRSPQGKTPEEIKAIEAADQERMKKGPFVFASVRREGMDSMTGLYIGGLLIDIGGALLLTWLLLQTRPMSYGGRVMFVLVAALAGAGMALLADWNWWSYSAGYTATTLTDVGISWFLAGLLIAKVAAPKAA
jgi:hypothetical protein